LNQQERGAASTGLKVQNTCFISYLPCEELLPLTVKFLVEKKNEQVDIDFSVVKEFNDRDSFILKLQQILEKRNNQSGLG
jgi:hypothetical protein